MSQLNISNQLSSLGSDRSMSDNSSCKSSGIGEIQFNIIKTNASSYEEEKILPEAVTRLTDTSSSDTNESEEYLSGGIQTIVILNKSTQSMHVDKPKTDSKTGKMKKLKMRKEIVSSFLKPVNYRKILKELSNKRENRKITLRSGKNIAVSLNPHKSSIRNKLSSQKELPELNCMKLSMVDLQEYPCKNNDSASVCNNHNKSVSSHIIMSRVNKLRCSKTRGNSQEGNKIKRKFITSQCNKVSSFLKNKSNNSNFSQNKQSFTKVSIFGPKMSQSNSRGRWDPYSTKYVKKSCGREGNSGMINHDKSVKSSMKNVLKIQNLYKTSKEKNRFMNKRRSASPGISNKTMSNFNMGQSTKIKYCLKENYSKANNESTFFEKRTNSMSCDSSPTISKEYTTGCFRPEIKASGFRPEIKTSGDYNDIVFKKPIVTNFQRIKFRNDSRIARRII